MAGRPTIRDVALEAGVSTTTVSDALNDSGRLSAETRTRVAEVARRMGYTPSPTARSLRRQRVSAIGLYAPLLVDVAGGLAALEFYIRFAIGAAEAALTHGLALSLLPAVRDPEPLRGIALDGLIVTDPIRDDPVVKELGQRLPIVTNERDLSEGSDHAGLVENATSDALTELLDLLRKRGAQRIALVAPGTQTAWGYDLQTAYDDWVAAHASWQAVVQIPIASIREDVYAAARDLLDRDDPPDAIVSAPDGGALSVLRAANERGLRVPEDLLVASCVDGNSCAGSAPSITAIDLQPHKTGRAAALMLADLLSGNVDGERRVVLPAPVVERESTRR